MFAKTTSLKPLAAAAALCFAALGAQAATYNLQGVVETGPALNSVFSGLFSVDESILGSQPAFTGMLALDSFSLSAFSQVFTLAGADFTPVAVYDNGVMLGLNIQFSGSTPAVTLYDGIFDPSFAFMGYTVGGTEYLSSYSISAAVPEPSTWLMSLAGLAAIGALARRRKPADAAAAAA